MNRILFEPGMEVSKIPVMPLIIATDDIVAEAMNLRGAASVVIGNHYNDSPDENMDWNLRVKAARKICMNLLSNNIEAIVFDSRIGVVKDNYAAKDNDEDYNIDNENPEKIIVDNDKLFLLSLVKLNIIRLLEREDSFFFNPLIDKSWDENNIKEYSGGEYIDIMQSMK